MEGLRTVFSKLPGVEMVLGDKVPQRGTAFAGAGGGADDIAVKLGQQPGDVIFFKRFNHLVLGLFEMIGVVCGGADVLPWKLKYIVADNGAGRQYNGLLNFVFQFPDIAGPMVLE